jgi:hypothetical protein
MNKTTFLLAITAVFTVVSSFSQVGIGTTNPQSVLDVNSTTSGILIPRMTEAQRNTIPSPSESMLIYQNDNESGYYFYESGSWLKLNHGQIKASDVQFDNTAVSISDTNVQDAIETILNANDGYLEKITENSKSGYRIKGNDAASYGDIGNEAVDLSFNNSPSSTKGATGDYVFAAGFKTEASGHRSAAFGNNTVSSGEHSFAAGVNTLSSGEGSFAIGEGGTSSGAYSSSLGYNNVSSGAYSFSAGYALTSSGHASSSLGAENTSSGSYSLSSGFKSNASGAYSISLGRENISSGSYSFSAGYKSTSSGVYSISLGRENTSAGLYFLSAGLKTNALGNYSFAFGRENTSSAAYSVSLGAFNTNLAGNATSFIPTDRIFSIGIGISNTKKLNKPLKKLIYNLLKRNMTQNLCFLYPKK